MTIQFAGAPTRLGNQFQANFTVANYRSGTTFQLLQAADLNGSWTTDTVASVQTVVSNTQFRVITTNNTARTFFRIKSN
jgi:hypothetical protein